MSKCTNSASAVLDISTEELVRLNSVTLGGNDDQNKVAKLNITSYDDRTIKYIRSEKISYKCLTNEKTTTNIALIQSTNENKKFFATEFEDNLATLNVNHNIAANKPVCVCYTFSDCLKLMTETLQLLMDGNIVTNDTELTFMKNNSDIQSFVNGRK